MIRWQIRRFDRVLSTMDLVDREGRAGAEEGMVVVADQQTSGRGRAGRHWVAAPGSALLCSILLRPSVRADRITALPLIAGVAVAEAIEALSGADIQLKWPNDVWIAERKVGGVLVASRLAPGGTVDFVNLGIGINVADAQADLPAGATSVRAATGREVDRDKLLAVLLDRLERHYRAEPGTSQTASLAAWRRRAAMIGERVAVVQAGEELVGTMLGVDEDGALLLATPAGTRRVVEGDLMRGPRRTSA